MEDGSKPFFRYYNSRCNKIDTLSKCEIIDCSRCNTGDDQKICDMLKPYLPDKPFTILEINKYVTWKTKIHRATNHICKEHNLSINACYKCCGSNTDYERNNLFWNIIYTHFSNKYISQCISPRDDFMLKEKGIIYFQLLDNYDLEQKLILRHYIESGNNIADIYFLPPDLIHNVVNKNNLMSEIRNRKMRYLFPNILHATWSGEYISAEQIRLRESIPEAYGKCV